MNTLILTRGVPGCGKSTWVKDNFDGYSICPDDIRLMYCCPEMKVDGRLGISQKADKYVWEFVFKVLEQRMKLGCLTVIDATHVKESAINAYKKLCEKYNYTCYIKDFSKISLETCLERNANRYTYYKVVPEEIIKRMYETLMKSKIPSWCKDYEEEYVNENSSDFINANNFKEVFIFGDIHGCYNPLEKFFNEHPYSKDNLYIFVGDYLDRGIQNKEVLEFLIRHTDDDNFVFLEGNHERWLDFYSKDLISDIKSNQFLEHTLKEISSISKEDIKKFVSKLKPIYKFFVDKTSFTVTHGGLPKYFQEDELYTKQLINGIGEYKDSQLVDENWSENAKDYSVSYYSVHGHRNVDNVPMHNTKFTYNLCDKIEKGGYLRVLHFVGNEIKELMYKNDMSILQDITNSLYESLRPSITNSKWMQCFVKFKLGQEVCTRFGTSPAKITNIMISKKYTSTNDLDIHYGVRYNKEPEYLTKFDVFPIEKEVSEECNRRNSMDLTKLVNFDIDEKVFPIKYEEPNYSQNSKLGKWKLDEPGKIVGIDISDLVDYGGITVRYFLEETEKRKKGFNFDPFNLFYTEEEALKECSIRNESIKKETL